MSLVETKLMIDKSSSYCDSILFALVDECTKDLDAYIDNISANFKDTANIDNITLDNFILNLPMLIYYSSSKLEQLGLKDDISSIEKKRKISEILASSEAKLKSDRQIEAELASVDISLLNDIYQRAYRVVRSKLDTAYEVLASCKKIMSRRIEEYKVEHSDTGRQILHS